MKKIAIILFTLLSFGLEAQTIFKGHGIMYTNGAPNHAVYIPTYAEVAIDSSTGNWYQYNYDLGIWKHAGYRIDTTSTCATPTYTPADKQSLLAINSCDSLYFYRGGSWRHINSGGADTDNQTIDTLRFSGDTIYISLEDDGEAQQYVLIPGASIQYIDTLELDGDTLVISLFNDGMAASRLVLTGLTTTNTLNLSGNSMNSTVNGVSDTSLVIGQHTIGLAGNILTVNTNGITDTTLSIGTNVVSYQDSILTY